MEPTKPAAGAPNASDEPALLQEAQRLWHEVRGMAHEQLTLAALELRLAGESAVRMLVSGVLIAVLLVSAWIGLLAAGILWLVSLGVAAAAAILAGVVLNLALAALLYASIRRRSRHLQFPSTLRSLRPLPLKPQGVKT